MSFDIRFWRDAGDLGGLFFTNVPAQCRADPSR